MSRIVRCSLIQATNAAPPDASLEATKKAMLDKHVVMIEQAAKDGAQIVCLQEIFYGPYFCAEQTTKWYDFTERIPDGPTIKLMQDLARSFHQDSEGNTGGTCRLTRATDQARFEVLDE